MKVCKIQMDGCGPWLAVPISDDSGINGVLEEIRTFLKEQDGYMSLEIVDMTEDEINKLPEFQGW